MIHFFIAALLLSAACVPRPARAPGAESGGTPETVRRVPPDRWPPVADDLDTGSLEESGRRAVAALRQRGDRLLALGGRRVGTQLLIDTIEELLRLRTDSEGGGDFSARLKESFDLYRVGGPARFSAYYQPVIPASRERTDERPYPLYRKPADLVEADLGAFDAERKGERVVGRVDDKGRFVPYFDRRDIDVREALKGRGLEIAWLGGQFDRLNLHIQGSGLLRFPDGTEAMASFAATNGRPYRSVGLAVAGSGAMTREELNHDTLRRYLGEHPEGEAWLLSRNPRYTFFELAPLPKDAEPFGSMGQRLTPGRSIAVDPAVVPLGAVAYMVFPMVQADESGRRLAKSPTRRFALCQDTGGAIKGPARVDLYLGHGPEARATAHDVWDMGELYILLKKLPPRTR
ncbi:MAG: MltA domain-containing protein [Elusimicrobiota bacterium]